MRVYFSGHININHSAGTIANDIVIKSYVYPESETVWDVNDKYGVTRCTAKFDVSPTDLPVYIFLKLKN